MKMCLDTVKNDPNTKTIQREKAAPYEKKRALEPFRGRRLHYMEKRSLLKVGSRPQLQEGMGKGINMPLHGLQRHFGTILGTIHIS